MTKIPRRRPAKTVRDIEPPPPSELPIQLSKHDNVITLAEIKQDNIQALLTDTPIDCLGCGQRVALYDRKIDAKSAKQLVLMWKKHGRSWFHGPSEDGVSELGGAWARLSYWGLIENAPEKRNEFGQQGMWRVTEIGVQFIKEEVRLPLSARVFNQQLVRIEGKYIGIRDALARYFRLDDIL